VDTGPAVSKRANNEAVERALRGARFGRAWIRVACPFCIEAGHTDRKLSLGVSAGTGSYACFRCGARGRLQDAPDPSQTVTPQAEAAQTQAVLEPPEEYIALHTREGRYSLSLQPARDYLASRGLGDVRVWERYKIGAAADGYWAGRVIIPMISEFDDAVWHGWVARLWRAPGKSAEGRHGMKYLYPKGMQKGVTFWNHRALNIDTETPVMIVEGALDAIPFGDDAAAALGGLSHMQTEALLACDRPVCLVPDGDAWNEAWALTARLRFEGKAAGFIRLPPKVDPDEVDHSWLLDEAKRSLTRPL